MSGTTDLAKWSMGCICVFLVVSLCVNGKFQKSLIYHIEIENRSWRKEVPTVLHFLVGRVAHTASFDEARTLKKYLFWVEIRYSFFCVAGGPPRLAAGAGDR